MLYNQEDVLKVHKVKLTLKKMALLTITHYTSSTGQGSETLDPKCPIGSFVESSVRGECTPIFPHLQCLM